MNKYNAVLNVSKAIVDLIWNSIQKDAPINSVITTKKQICLAAPKEPESPEDKKLIIFLYNISALRSLIDQPTSKTEQSKTDPPALLLALHYLITPYTQNSESDQILLEKAIQIFAENPILPKPAGYSEFPRSQLFAIIQRKRNPRLGSTNSLQ